MTPIKPSSAAASLLLLAACGSSSSSTGAPGPTTSFDGTYAATFSGTYQNTSPNTDTGNSTSSATITVTNLSVTEVELSWQIPPNPPSGKIDFLMSGSSGALADAGASAAPPEDGGVAVGGACFTGVVNGNAQTNCCTSCTVSFSGNTFTQPNAGYYSGTTPQGVAYRGTYVGTWTGTRQTP